MNHNFKSLFIGRLIFFFPICDIYKYHDCIIIHKYVLNCDTVTCMWRACRYNYHVSLRSWWFQVLSGRLPSPTSSGASRRCARCRSSTSRSRARTHFRARASPRARRHCTNTPWTATPCGRRASSWHPRASSTSRSSSSACALWHRNRMKYRHEESAARIPV